MVSIKTVDSKEKITLNRSKWWFPVLMSFLYFPVRVKGYTFITYIIVYLIPIMYLMVNIGWVRGFLHRIFHSKIGYTALIFFGLLIVSIVYPIIHGTFDFSYIYLYWRYFILIMLKSIFLLAVYEKRISKGGVTGYINCFLYALCLYVAFTIVTLMIPVLRDWLVTHLYMTPKEYEDSLDPVYRTRFGWAGFAGFGMTMHCSIGVILVCGMLIKYARTYKRQIKYFGILTVLLLGNMFYGRSGMFVSLLCICLTFIRLYFKRAKKAIAIIMLASCVMMGMIVVLKDHNPQINTWYRWCFSIIDSFLKTGKATDGSLRVLTTKMYWIPSVKTILFGDGYYMIDGAYYMHTDSGIMRPMLYYGILFYMLGVCGVINFYYCIKKEFSRRNILSQKDAAFLTVLLLLSTCLMEVKGEAYYIFICVLMPVITLSAYPEKI